MLVYAAACLLAVELTRYAFEFAFVVILLGNFSLISYRAAVANVIV